MKVLLIEDDKQLSQFVGKGLEEHGYSVSHAANGNDGLDLALNEHFDVGVFDLMLPGVSGISILERMRNQSIQSPVLILSARRSVDDRVRGLQIGGDDYMTKPFSFAELVARVQALVRRSSLAQHAAAGTISVCDLTINTLSRQVMRDGRKIYLQPREFALLEYLANHYGQVVSKTMIIEQVWNYNFDPQTNIVEARISKLREKIDRDFNIPLIHTVRGLGYILKEDYV